MKLKNRLLTAFVIMTLLPIVLVLILGTAILQVNNFSLRRNYNMDFSIVEVLTSPMKIVDAMTQEKYEQMCEAIRQEPDAFREAEFCERENEQFTAQASYLVVRADDQIIFDGVPGRMVQGYDRLPMYTEEAEDGESYYLNLPEGQYIVKSQDFKFSDGGSGTAFLVTDMGKVLPQARSMMIQMIFAVFLIILITATLLTIWIYQGILRPINELRKATHEMEQGNLEYEIKYEDDEDDNIALLCQDFDHMRERLNETINGQLEYEKRSLEMVSNISHDLKTPLTAIKGYTEGILDGIADTPERREKYLTTILSKANDMQYLVDELSDFAKIEQGTIVYNFTEVNVDQFFFDCISEVSLDLEMVNIRISYTNYVNKDTMVVADPEQLKRVVNNIIGNSIKYMDKDQGSIRLLIENEPEMVKVSVEDNGRGIAPEDAQKIFERFYRGDMARSSSKLGSGLGLSICKKIIEDHGGEISAKGARGVGTTISFTLKKAKGKHELQRTDRGR